MKQFAFGFFMVATAAACLAQTPAKPSVPSASAKPAATSSAMMLPPGVPRARGIVKTAFSLRYQDIRIGTGKEAEPNKVYKVHYTGWLASDGHKFDSSYDHKTPVIGKDGKPELDAEGKPKVNETQPITFLQGFRQLIPGFDEGFTGMRVGGKRRLFIPWQLAYGARGRPGPNAANPGIPPKADLIFDIELVEMSEPQMPQGHPGMGTGPNGQRMMPHPPPPGTPGAPATAAPQSTPPAATTPAPSATPANPATPPATTPTTPPATTPTTPPPDKPQSR